MYDTIDSRLIQDLGATYNNFRDYHDYEESMIPIFIEGLREGAQHQWYFLEASMEDASPAEIRARFQHWLERQIRVFRAGLLREYQDDERTWLYARLRQEKAQNRELRLQLHVAQNALDQTRARLRQERLSSLPAEEESA